MERGDVKINGQDAPSGIYEIVNKSNGHRYIGSAKNLIKRWATHKWALTRNRHHSIYFQNAWNKYGRDAFEFNVLAICPIDLLIYYEQQFINQMNPEYNIAPVAGSSLGIKATDETKRKMSVARRGNKYALGFKHTDETRRKISEGGKGKVPWIKGKHHSEETKAKIRASLIGIKRSDETKLKHHFASLGNKSNTGRKFTEEERRQISILKMGNTNWLGRKHTEETKEKMRIAQALRRSKEKEYS